MEDQYKELIKNFLIYEKDEEILHLILNLLTNGVGRQC